MRLLIQRVAEASVTIDGEKTGEIGKGYLVFLGIGEGDTREIVEKMFRKMYKLRIFQDADGKTNQSITEAKGELLVVSQFTLYADCRKGNRPSFVKAGSPVVAEELYEYFLSLCREEFGSVAHGSFGADMKVALVNDGPFTVFLDSRELGISE